jgi:hypothetical protein
MALCASAVSNQGSPFYDEASLFAAQGFKVCEAAFEYRPRHPEETVLYKVVAENIESFLARQQERERVVPRFVERELRAFLECCILANGFIRVYCDTCRKDLAVPYSCKH